MLTAPKVPSPNFFSLWKECNCDQGQVLSRTVHPPLLKQVSYFPLTFPDTHPIIQGEHYILGPENSSAKAEMYGF